MQFVYTWDETLPQNQTRWVCNDGYVDEKTPSYVNHIFWRAKTFNSYYNAGGDSMIMD